MLPHVTSEIEPVITGKAVRRKRERGGGDKLKVSLVIMLLLTKNQSSERQPAVAKTFNGLTASRRTAFPNDFYTQK